MHFKFGQSSHSLLCRGSRIIWYLIYYIVHPYRYHSVFFEVRYSSPVRVRRGMSLEVYTFRHHYCCAATHNMLLRTTIYEKLQSHYYPTKLITHTPIIVSKAYRFSNEFEVIYVLYISQCIVVFHNVLCLSIFYQWSGSLQASKWKWTSISIGI